jgi:hypothetical protein
MADLTRDTFRPDRHYRSVRMQQGRVQLDADWNEQADILAHLDAATHGDVIGGCGVPKEAAGFEIRPTPDGTDLTISAGRAYVEGILCELEATPVVVSRVEGASVRVEQLVTDGVELVAHDWVALFDQGGSSGEHLARLTEVDRETRTLAFVPALDERDLTALTADTAQPALRRVASYTTQRHLPEPAHTGLSEEGEAPQLQAGDGTYLAYLDVFERPVTALEDPGIREVALGGPDTATRLQTVWQVRLARLEGAVPRSCEEPPDWSRVLEAGARPPSTGRLRARSEPEAPPEGPCVLPPGAGYRRLENQLYRVEVHRPGGLDEATFKWSRDNGSVVAGWIGQSGDVLTVSTLGRDGVLGFASGQLVELLDDGRELHGIPGVLARITEPPRDATLVVDPAEPVDRVDFPHNPRVRRWDSADERTITTPTDEDGWLRLESGVEVRFEPGHYNTGDHWLIPARTVGGDVDWPRDRLGRPLPRPPIGVLHQHCRLALVHVEGGSPSSVEDCREGFPSLTAIEATDVGFDNASCELPGATTVQDALDVLCEGHTLRRHNKHLHGWGIVSGLQVVCGPNPPERPRSHVTVREGYAIDGDGNDIVLDADEEVDVLALIRALDEEDPDRPVLAEGDGEVCLILQTRPDGTGYRIAAERYDPFRDTPEGLLAGTLLMDVYFGCIKRVEDFLRAELTGDDGGGAGSGFQREAVLANLLTQIVNPQAGQGIYLSAREHDILQGFYERLRALLRSETFCAMFDAARPFPDYPAELPPEMDTIFGRGHHSRLRLRPGRGDRREAYTVGGGINPLRPATAIHRYDLERRELVARIDPVAGAADDADVDSGSGAVQDVAFSPDGGRIYMVAQTRNEENTLFRAGRVTADGVRWGPLTTICGVQLVTLATTVTDPRHVYAIGMGRGLYRIDPDDVDPSMEPVAAFAAAGHLVVSDNGRAVTTAAAETSLPRYDRLRGFRLPGADAIFEVVLRQPGMDDIAVQEPAQRSEEPTVYCVVGVDGSGEKRIEAYDLRGRTLGVSIPTDDSTVRLATLPPGRQPGLLLVTSEDGYVLRLVDTDRREPVAGYELPLQAGPIAIVADGAVGTAYVLNYVTNTITVAPPEVLGRQFRFPFEALATYRSGVLEAFADLAGGFLQYLKDCLCHHLLIAMPEGAGDEPLYLACVSIRGNQVYNVCNFSGRRYVKSFPAVGYWLSLVPVLPLARRLLEWFCCSVLPEAFGGIEAPVRDVPEPAPARPHHAIVRGSTVRGGVAGAQSADLPGQFRRGRRTLGVVAGAGATSLVDGLATAPSRRSVDLGDVLGEPAENVAAMLHGLGMQVQRKGYEAGGGQGILEWLTTLFRPPRPGDRVTLHEREDRVRAVTVNPVADAADPRVDALVDSLEKRDEEISALREQVEELRAFRDEVTTFMGAEGNSGPGGPRTEDGE